MIVIISVVLGLLSGNSLDYVLGIIATISVTPIVFIFPAAFHLKNMPQTQCRRGLNWFVIVFGFVVIVVNVVLTLVNWIINKLFPHSALSILIDVIVVGAPPIVTLLISDSAYPYLLRALTLTRYSFPESLELNPLIVKLLISGLPSRVEPPVLERDPPAPSSMYTSNY